MSRNYVPFAFTVLLVLAAPARAQGPTHAVEVPAVASPGNTAEAEAILRAKLLVCSTCHGERGAPRTVATPIIWGQEEAFLLKQLRDFQSGSRRSEVMRWMATALTPAELPGAAAYFAKKDWPARAINAASPAAPSSVAVCQICHQQNLAGGATAPRLAGQNYDYLVGAMRRYADAAQAANTQTEPMLQRKTEMMTIMEAIPPADREALARYMASL